MTTGLVYYVLDATRLRQLVKIGFTTNLKARLADLTRTTMSQQTPIVLALEVDAGGLEQERHVQFADLREHGEWFRYEDPLRTHLDRLHNPHGFLLDRHDLWPFAQGFGPVPPAPGRQRERPVSRAEASAHWGPAVPVEF